MRVEKQLWFWLAALALVVVAIALLKDILLPFVAAIVVAYFLNPDRRPAAGARTEPGLGGDPDRRRGRGAAGVGAGPAGAGPRRPDAPAGDGAAGRDGALQGLRRSASAATGWAPAFPRSRRRSTGTLADLSQNWTAMAGAVMASVWSRGLALVNFVSLLLITPVVVFYLLVDWHPMLARIDDALPRDHAPTIRRLAGEINDAVAAFIRGQGTICLVLGIFYAIGLSWAGIDYGLLVGLTTGLLAFIPIIGWLLGLIFAAGLAIVQFWPDLTPLLKVVGVLVARHRHRHRLPVAALRRAEDRPASGLADLRAVRVQLSVRSGRHAGGGAAGGGHRRARALRRAAVPGQLRLQGQQRHGAAAMTRASQRKDKP